MSLEQLLQSHTARQILGAIGGMAAAALLYVGYTQFSSYQLNKAMLVEDNPAISENAGQVRINRQLIDQRTLDRLQTQAKQVAARQRQAALEKGIVTLPTEASPTATPQAQMVARLNATTRAAVPTYLNDDDRVKMRMTRIIAGRATPYDPAPEVADDGVTVIERQIVPASEAMAAIEEQQEPVITEKTPPPVRRLTNSGAGMGLAAMLALLLGVTYCYHGTLRQRAVALLAGRHV